MRVDGESGRGAEMERGTWQEGERASGGAGERGRGLEGEGQELTCYEEFGEGFPNLAILEEMAEKRVLQKLGGKLPRSPEGAAAPPPSPHLGLAILLTDRNIGE